MVQGADSGEFAAIVRGDFNLSAHKPWGGAFHIDDFIDAAGSDDVNVSVLFSGGAFIGIYFSDSEYAENRAVFYLL